MLVLQPTLAHPRRDRLGPRHRRAEDRGRRRERDAIARSRHRRRDPLPAAAQLHRARLRPRADRRPHRASRAARSWRSSSRKRATAGSDSRGRAGGRAGVTDGSCSGSARGSSTAGRASSRSSRRARRRPAPVRRGSRQRRDAAMARFAAQGFPTTRDEEWRFTPVAPIADTRVRAPASCCTCRPTISHPGSSARETAAELVFVNGHLRARALVAVGEPAGGTRSGRAQPRARRRRRELEPYLAQNRRGQRLAVHGAEHGAVRGRRVRRRCAKNAVIERPVHVLFYSTVVRRSERVASPAARRHRRARGGRIIETYAGRRASAYFTNAVSEFVAGDRAVVDHYRVQRESTAAYHVGRDAGAHGPRDACSCRTTWRSAPPSPATTSARCSAAKAATPR